MTLEAIRQQAVSEWREFARPNRQRVLVGAATCGRAAGALDVLAAFREQLLAVTGDDPVREAATTWREWIAGETLARELVIGSVNWEPDRIEPIVIDEHAAALAVRRHGEGRTESGPLEVDQS